MITCLGLVVGAIETPYRKDVVKTCADFLLAHRNLIKVGITFEVEGVPYLEVIDVAPTIEPEFANFCFKFVDGETIFA